MVPSANIRSYRLVAGEPTYTVQAIEAGLHKGLYFFTFEITTESLTLGLWGISCLDNHRGDCSQNTC